MAPHAQTLKRCSHHEPNRCKAKTSEGRHGGDGIAQQVALFLGEQRVDCVDFPVELDVVVRHAIRKLDAVVSHPSLE
eukprot:scaffold9926_cov117-Isochrysis_galbana.AAC.1